MNKLSDTQSILLATAAQRASGSVYPLPTTLRAPAATVKRSLMALVNRHLIEERETARSAEIVREERARYVGLFVTPAGRAAIGIDVQLPTDLRDPTPSDPTELAPTSKAARVIGLLNREQGATVDELIAVTGWLPHTTRAALSGLRKKGHILDRTKRGEVSCYRITGVA